jgi:AhpD family alkylhydroperoxidase
MPRIQPVDRNHLEPETLTLLKAISGGESRWNVFEGIANHPPTLQAMNGLRQGIDAGLTTLEQEVIAIEIARHNGCGYCLPAHRYVCSEIGVDLNEVDALTRGELLEQKPGLLAIQQFVRAAMEKKGLLGDEEFADFQSRGIADDKMIVILSEIALYTLLNYFNRLAGTEIEEQVLPFISDEANWITPPDR